MTRLNLWSSDKGDVPANLAFTNNLSATANPGAGNDSTQRYQPGSVWVNLVTDQAFICVDSTAGAAIWALIGSSGNLGTQSAPASQDTAATLTAAQLRTGIITSNPAGAIALTLPLATDLDAALPQAGVNSSFDFSVINLSANVITMTTNTGWTITGTGVMTVAGTTSARFRARKTATGAWTLYRLS